MPELRRAHGLCMSRPKRKAAEAAVERIQHILEWESTPESSKLFKTCAAAIDAEFAREHKHKRVKYEEVAESDGDATSGDEEGAEMYTKEDMDFVEEDEYAKVDGDWLPQTHAKGAREEGAGCGDAAPERGGGGAGSEDAGSGSEDPAEVDV